MSREGRAQPIQPFAAHGFVGNTPANGVLPPAPSVVPLIDERKRQRPPLPALVVSGAQYVTAAPPAVNPPVPVVVPIVDLRRRVAAGGEISVGYPSPDNLPPPSVVSEPDDQRRRRRAPQDPVSLNGTLAGLPAPATVTPPPPVNVDRADQRGRYKTPDPTISNPALLGVQPPPTVLPTQPFVVPLDERRRFLAALDATIISGAQRGTTPPPTVQPPPPTVVPLEPRRKPTGGGYISVGYPDADTGTPPPGPFVVPIEERRYILDRLRRPTSTHGFLGNTPANGVLPPPGVNLDRVDQRARYLPQPTLVLSGVLVPFIPPPPVTVNPGTDWAAEMSTW